MVLSEEFRALLIGLRKRLAERNIVIEFSNVALGWLVRKGYGPGFGARPLKRIIQKEVEMPFARKPIRGELDFSPPISAVA